MPRVVFTPNLARHISCPPQEVEGTDVRSVLEAVFEENPRLRGYILDDQGALRQHVVVFIDGQRAEDRSGLGDRVPRRAEVYVMQALSGG
jgi:sulfur-carrier protein